MAQGPAIVGAVVHDDARQRGLLAGQAGQVLGLDRRLECGEGIADQQRLLLPVVAQELRGGHAERGQGARIDLDEGRDGCRGLLARLLRGACLLLRLGLLRHDLTFDLFNVSCVVRRQAGLPGPTRGPLVLL
jgi:hypothetical protein